MGQPERYSRVYLLCTEMVVDAKGNHVFPNANKDGAIHGEARVHAARIILEKGLAPAIFPVGGIDKDGFDKVTETARMISEDEMKVQPLWSTRSTQGNAAVIHEHLAHNPPMQFVGYAQVGILTQFHHLPRAMRMLHDQRQHHIVPVCAEAILLAYDREKWLPSIMEWYSAPEMTRRLIKEMEGAAAIENNSYGT